MYDYILSYTNKEAPAKTGEMNKFTLERAAEEALPDESAADDDATVR